MLKDHNLKITDFVPNKKKRDVKNKKSFLNSILLYVHNFFEDENNIRPNISKFYLPLPRINIKLIQLGGISSLQYDLYRRDICLEFDRSEKEILKDFYSELINLDLQNSKKTRRIIALENLYKLFYISRDLDNSLEQICYKDSNNNLRFNPKFFIIFERYKKQAILKLIEHYYENLNVDDFEIKFPQLKNKITRIIKSKKSRLFLTFGHTGDLSYGIGFEFLKYCSERLYNNNHCRLISSFNKILSKGTNKVKPHIVRKLSTLLSKFESYKKEQVNNFHKLIKSLLELISYKNTCKPFWIRNDFLLFYYYRTPHGVWQKNSSKYNSIKERIIKKYNICQKIPIQSNLRFIPRLWFKKIDRNIYFATLDKDKRYYITDGFFSMENLNKANEDDKEFFRYLSIR